jgi:pimeloyl-ACP methyl ester carboxylesterase
MNVPLDYNAANGTQIRMFVKRFVKNVMAPKPALYMLMGGPGGSSEHLEVVANALHKLIGDQFDLYLPEHRGVGRSTRLTCVAPQAETIGSEGGITITDSEMVPCAAEFKYEYDTNTAKFSSPDAARDVVGLITTIKSQSAGAAQYIYGVSYGTMWATRIMQLKPGDLISGVILDSVMSTAAPADSPRLRTTLDQWDSRMNDVGLAFMNQCGNDTFCQSKLKTQDAFAYTANVFQNVFVNQTCKAIAPGYNVTADSLRNVLGTFLMSRTLRELVPAILYRLNRCDADMDVPTLQYLIDNLKEKLGQTPTCQPLSSTMLFNNIAFNEIWPTQNPPTYEQLYAIYNTTFFATGQYKAALVKQNTNWPAYSPGADFENKGFDATCPVLLMNGDLDPQTPFDFAEQQFSNINAAVEKKKLIKFPGAVHGIILNTPVNNTEPKVDCGMQIVISFLKNAGDLSKLDLSCQDNISPISFKGTSDLNQKLMGVSDIFEDAYEPPEVVKTVNLYLFIGVEAGTAVLAIVIICCLIYYIVVGFNLIKND